MSEISTINWRDDTTDTERPRQIPIPPESHPYYGIALRNLRPSEALGILGVDPAWLAIDEGHEIQRYWISTSISANPPSRIVDSNMRLQATYQLATRNEQKLRKVKHGRAIITGIAIFSTISIIACLVLSIGNVLHWSLWLPGIVAFLGVLGANLIQLSKLDEAIKHYELRSQ